LANLCQSVFFFFAAIVNEIAFLISISESLLLSFVCWFSIFEWILLNWLICSISFWCSLQSFIYMKLCHLWTEIILFLPFQRVLWESEFRRGEISGFFFFFFRILEN
jgi:hypothetical protein